MAKKKPACLVGTVLLYRVNRTGKNVYQPVHRQLSVATQALAPQDLFDCRQLVCLGTASKVDATTLLGPQSRFWDKLLEICVVCPQNGTAVLKGLNKLERGPYFTMNTKWCRHN